ncbi:MAG: efflux RND transporter periplasmic adaptor subunit [Myxococcota bacterium]
MIPAPLSSPPPTTPLLSIPRRRARASRGACLGLIALAAIACQGEPPPPRASHTVERGSIERLVIATGTIEPATEVEVRPRIAGIIEKIRVQEGDLVEPGQPLVEIERELLASQVREAEALLEAANVELKFAGIARDRAEELHTTGAASDQARDDALARFEQARAARSSAKAVLDTLNTTLGYATITSTLTGRVLEVHVEEGDAISPVTSVTGGTLLLSLAGDATLHLEGLVDENEIARVEIDQPARIRTEAFGDREFEGRVREIAPMGQRVQNVTYFEVKVEITDAEASRLRPRMSGDAEIVTEVVEDAVVVPETALRYRGTEILVDLDPGDGPEQETDPDANLRVVEVGIIDGDRVQITDGLEPGARIVLQ